MPKIIFAALTTALFALPAVAQSIDIDDDGWTNVGAKPQPTLTVDIDDDGWDRVDVSAQPSNGEPMSAYGQCTQLEMSAGLSGMECGVMSQSEVTTLKGDE